MPVTITQGACTRNLQLSSMNKAEFDAKTCASLLRVCYRHYIIFQIKVVSVIGVARGGPRGPRPPLELVQKKFHDMFVN